MSAARLEEILTADESDRVQEALGASERNVAQTVLVLASIPSLTIPVLFQLLRKNVYVGVLVLAACLTSFFFIIQYRLDWIIILTDRLKTLYYERIRI